MKRYRTIVIAAVAAAASAQQGSVVFRTTTNLVVVDVVARDRAGKEISGLTKDDFTILEDGKPQKISIFEFQKLDDGPLPPMPAPQLSAREPRPPTAGLARPQVISTAAPGKVQYQDRRLIVMFFDFSSMGPAEQLRAQNAAVDFLNKRMTSADMVAVMTFSSELKVAQDFTNDRDELERTIRGFHIGESSELSVEGETGDDQSGADNGEAFVPDETEFNIFNTDRKLSALESATHMLAGLPEKKAVVYFSSGVGKTGVENQSQLRSTINAAVRANVSFYPIDARGLTAIVPGGDASQPNSRGTGVFSGSAQRQQMDRFNDQQETLVSLAEDTGGKALLDSNDLTTGIAKAQESLHSYYIVGYYSTNPALDGRYRRIQIKLANKLQAKLDYRGGYFAAKEFGKFTESDKERQLEEALALGDPITDLPLALEIDYFRLRHDSYFIPVSVKIPGSSVALARKGANQVTEFDFIGQVRDAKGRVAAVVRDGIRVKLNQENASELGTRSLQYDTGFTLAPGDYRLKFLARENQTGKIGTFETTFKVPDLNSQSDRVRVSSVVWSNQMEALTAAVGSAGTNKKLLASDPLIHGDKKLVPSVTRVFRKRQSLYVYLEVYDPAADPADRKPSVAATLSFYRGHAKAFESEPVHLTDLAARRTNTVPVRFQVPLEKLGAGQYTCQVTVLDEVGRKFSFRRSRLVLLP